MKTEIKNKQKQTEKRMNKTKILIGAVSFCSLIVMSVLGVQAGFGGVTGATIVPTDNTENTAPGATTISFDIATLLPTGGEIQINIPTEFTAGDIADASSNLTLTAGTTTIASADLTSKVLTVTTGTADIAASATVQLDLDATVIDTNPMNEGYYGFQITTLDASDQPIDTGIAFLHIGTGVPISTEVEEVMLLGIDGNSLSFDVDPSVNSGLDNSQSSTLTVTTNALNYSIAGELTNTQNSNNSLYGTYGDEIPTSDTESANTLSVNLTGSGNVGNDALDGGYIVNNAEGLGQNLETDVYYRLKVDYTISGGTYEGDLVYTVFPTF